METMTSSILTIPVRAGMFCWLEHHSSDPARASQFWSQLLGGAAQEIPFPDGTVMRMHEREGHPMFSMMPCPSYVEARGSHWLPTIAVDDIDAAHARALAAGARSLLEPHDNPFGRASVLEDPQGAAIGLFTAAAGKTDGINPHGHGFMCWCELVTPDPEASARFYATLCGWECADRAMSSGSSGFTIKIAQLGGHPIASIFKRCIDDAHPWPRARWCPYLQVDRVEPLAARITELGGSLPCPAMPIEGVGEWQSLNDACGCETALLQPIARGN